MEKDYARLVQFVETGKFDKDKLVEILTRHDLLEKWKDFGAR